VRHPAPLVAVYPNPVSGGRALTVELEPSRSAAVAELYSVAGQKVNTARALLAANQHWLKLDTTGLRPGVYMLRVHGQEYDMSRRVLVVK